MMTKHTIKGTLILCAIAAMLAAVCMTGCSEPQGLPTEPRNESYTITVLGGTADKQTAQAGETVTITYTPSVDGASFKEWTVVRGEFTIENDSFTMPASNVVIKAEFEKLDYTVTVTGGTADKTTAQEGDTVTLTVGDIPSGKEFSHWTVNGDKIDGNSFEMPAENVEAVAVITNTRYAITVVGGSADKERAEAGDTVTLTADAPNTGYEFKGWTAEPNGVTVVDNGFTMPEENVTVTAVFEKIDYTVSVTGGSADKTTANYGDTVMLTVGDIPSGKEFSHWTVNGDKINGNSFEMPAENVEAVAVITNIGYTITVTGGSADKQKAEAGDTVTLTANAPATGMRFEEWKVVTGDVTMIENSFTMPAGNVEIEAVFEKIDYTVTVTGGSADKTTASYGDEITLTANAAETGYEFKSWTISADGVTVSGNKFTMPAENVTVTAVFGKTDYAVTVTGGTAVATANYGDTVALTANAPALGERFKEWKVVTGDVTITENSFTMPAGNVEIEAVFEKIDYTVTVTGGSVDKTTANYGDEITLTATPDDGYELYYWTVNGERINGNSFTMPAENVTVTATHARLEKLNTSVSTVDYIYKENSSAIALDRSGGTIFREEHTDHIRLYIYDSETLQPSEYLGYIKIVRDPAGDGTNNAGYLYSHDEVKRVILRGGPAGYYHEVGNTFFELVKYELGYDFCSGKTYYFAFRIMSNGDIANENGEWVKYTDGDISAICTYSGASGKNPVVQDPNKPDYVLTINVTDGFINGDKTSLQAGTGNVLALSAKPSDTLLFAGWYNGDRLLSDKYEFDYTVDAEKSDTTVALVAKFVAEDYEGIVKLTTPKTSEKHIYREGDINSAIAIGRDAESLFFSDAGVDHVKFYVYESADATEAIGEFDFRLTNSSPFVARVETADGSESYAIVRGNPRDNFYISDNFDRLRSVLKYALGVRYSEGKTYYFAVRLCREQIRTIWQDSDISGIAANGVAFGGTLAAEYTVTVTDGEQTVKTVTAYAGSLLTLDAQAPAGKTAAWYVADGDEFEFVGFDGMKFEISGDMTLRYVFADESAVDSIEAPDNADDKMIRFNGATIEYDRQKNTDGSNKTAFADGVDTLIVHVYLSNDKEAKAVAWFKIVYDAATDKAYMCALDGDKRFDMLGELGNLFTPDGNAHNRIKDYIANYLDNYRDDELHYYAFQAVKTSQDGFAASDIGSVGNGWGQI